MTGLTQEQEMMLDEDTKTLLKADFLSSNFSWTPIGLNTLLVLVFKEHKEAVLKEAQRRIKEHEKWK